MSPPDPATRQVAQPGATLVTVGDIACSRFSVTTPAGTFPLAGTTWTVSDNWTVTEVLPSYAVVLAIAFFVFCLLGLLFLLIKERRCHGCVQVTVHGPGLFHATQVPVSDLAVAADVHARVDYIRSVVAALPR